MKRQTMCPPSGLCRVVALFAVTAAALLFVSRASSAQAPPTVTASIPVAMNPYSAAVNPTTDRVYIANSNSVTVVDGATEGVVATIPLADDPTGVINSIGVNAATNRMRRRPLRVRHRWRH